jgi:hypothetical protein
MPVLSEPDQPPNTSSATTAAAHTADTIESAIKSAAFGRDGAAAVKTSMAGGRRGGVRMVPGGLG